MALDIVVQSLLRVELFAGLKPLQVAEIARQADRIVYRPGQSIITEGEPGDAAVLIVMGDAVRLAPGSPATPVQPVPVGALVGELAMLIETLHGTTVVSRGVTRAIRIGRAALHEQMAQDPAVAITLARNMSKRLTAVAQELARIDRVLEGAVHAAATETVDAADFGRAAPEPKRIASADLEISRDASFRVDLSGLAPSRLGLSGLTARATPEHNGSSAGLGPMPGTQSHQMAQVH